MTLGPPVAEPTPTTGETGSANEALVPGTVFPVSQTLRALLKERCVHSRCDRVRKHERYTCPVPITIERENGAGPDGRPERHDVVIESISAGGFACICRADVQPGTLIRANFGELEAGTTLRAVVRRCFPTWYGTYRLGVAFLDR
jgi:hypothetical protein